MQLHEVKQEMFGLQKLFDETMSMTNKEELDQQVKKLDQITYDQVFWDDQESAQKVIKSF